MLWQGRRCPPFRPWPGLLLPITPRTSLRNLRIDSTFILRHSERPRWLNRTTEIPPTAYAGIAGRSQACEQSRLRDILDANDCVGSPDESVLLGYRYDEFATGAALVLLGRVFDDTTKVGTDFDSLRLQGRDDGGDLHHTFAQAKLFDQVFSRWYLDGVRNVTRTLPTSRDRSWPTCWSSVDCLATTLKPVAISTSDESKLMRSHGLIPLWAERSHTQRSSEQRTISRFANPHAAKDEICGLFDSLTTVTQMVACWLRFFPMEGDIHLSCIPSYSRRAHNSELPPSLAEEVLLPCVIGGE